MERLTTVRTNPMPILECNIGDKVYFRVKDYCPIQQKRVDFIQYQEITTITIYSLLDIVYKTASLVFNKNDIGKTVFFTREDAEAIT